MKIFLVKDVSGLGQRGEMKEVADGYGRYLIKTWLAVLPDDKKVSEIKAEKDKKAAMAEKEKLSRESMIKEISAKTYVFKAKAQKNGKLYGSIGPKELSEKIGLPPEIFKDHFKELGQFNLLVSSGDGEAIQLKIDIRKEE